MRGEALHIERLHIAVPGTTREHGLAVAAAVARRLETALPGLAAPRSLGALRVTISAAPGASPTDLADRIAAAVVRSLA